jgi:hypothetical protein
MGDLSTGFVESEVLRNLLVTFAMNRGGPTAVKADPSRGAGLGKPGRLTLAGVSRRAPDLRKRPIHPERGLRLGRRDEGKRLAAPTAGSRGAAQGEETCYQLSGNTSGQGHVEET